MVELQVCAGHKPNRQGKYGRPTHSIALTRPQGSSWRALPCMHAFGRAHVHIHNSLIKSAAPSHARALANKPAPPVGRPRGSARTTTTSHLSRRSLISYLTRPTQPSQQTSPPQRSITSLTLSQHGSQSHRLQPPRPHAQPTTDSDRGRALKPTAAAGTVTPPTNRCGLCAGHC